MSTIDERARDAIRDAKAAYEVAEAKHKAASPPSSLPATQPASPKRN